jgi:tetratricopeptide (TPR) repeat protein
MKHFFTAGSRSGFGTWLPLLLVLAACSPAVAADSWVGKTILTKKAGIRIGHSKDGESVYTATLRSLYYRVLAEKDGFIKVREGGVEDWFNKDDAVLLEDAVDFCTDRIRANPEDARAYVARAAAWELRGELDIAIRDYDETIRLAPKNASAFFNRGNAWLSKKDYDRAIKDYNEAIRLDPKNAYAFNNRGVAHRRKKDYDRAIKDYNEAIRLDPKYVAAFRNRGLAYRLKKDYDRAIKDYDEAIRLDPKFASAFNSRAWLLATCPDASYRDGKKAVDLAKKAIELAGKDADSYYHGTLAAAYAEVGQFDKAVAEQRKALEDKSLDSEDRAKMEQRLKLYREEKPYRDVE